LTKQVKRGEQIKNQCPMVCSNISADAQQNQGQSVCDLGKRDTNTVQLMLKKK
jgi:hypothetical protein